MYVIQELLGITHAQWTARCQILHQRDSQGLPINDGASLTAAIDAMLQTSPLDLLAGDRSLLSRRSPEQLHKLSPTNKVTWLHSMRLAKEVAAEELASEANGMRTIMRDWLDQPD